MSDTKTHISMEQCLGNAQLPSLPVVALQVLELTQCPDVDLTELSEVVSNDQALASKVLRTVNSSYYALTTPCATIRQALVYLGVNTVRTLVLGFSLVESVDADKTDEPSFDFVNYWRHGLYSAVAAREIALIHDLCDPDEAFLGALIQDIGMIALHRAVGDRYLETLDSIDGDYRLLDGIEKESYGLTHCTVGAELAKRWGLPPQLSACIKHHHDSTGAASEWFNLVRTVNLANAVAIGLTRPNSESTLRNLASNATRWFELDGQQITSMLAVVRESSKELSTLLEFKQKPPPAPSELLAKAERRLVEIQMEIARENEALRRENEALSKQAYIDPLTGAANRMCFDAELQKCFDRAVSNQEHLSLVFCDIDHFKPVNDNHGHQVGDHVLIETAKLMREIVGDRGVVARYGGEEFAMILPSLDMRAATLLAEDIRKAIEQTTISLGPLGGEVKELNITISLGVATYDDDVAPIMTQPQMLTRVADRAVYAAKAGGRNCVRVYQHRDRPAA